METPTLIYCGGGNARYAQIAIEAGFRYGAQVPCTVYGDLWFCDQDWKKPNRTAYMAALARYRPHMASVLDWEREEQFREVMDWAEEAAQYAERVMIIPKIRGSIPRIPATVGSKPIVVGFSVPTRHGATPCGLWEFYGRPVHLLGGSPHRQMYCYAFLRCNSDVVSADGNMHMKMANQFCAFWTLRKTRSGHWTRCLSSDGQKWGKDAPYEAFRRSCLNIMDAWKGLK